MGRVCVFCVVLCVAARVRAGQGVHLYGRGGREVVEGPQKVDSLHIIHKGCERNCARISETDEGTQLSQMAIRGLKRPLGGHVRYD